MTLDDFNTLLFVSLASEVLEEIKAITFYKSFSPFILREELSHNPI